MLQRTPATLLAIDPDAVEIGQLWAKAKSSIVDAARYQLECGYRLTLKRQEFGPRSGWFRWLKANTETLGFETDRTARLLTAAWKRWRKGYRSDEEAYRKLTSGKLDVAKAKKINRELWNNDAANSGWVNSGNFEWYTQERYIKLARTVLGQIDLDPASCEIAQRTVRAKRFFTKEDDGSTKEWHGRIFLNPPFAGKLITRFTNQLLKEYSAGRTTAAILLTNAFTSCRWFQRAGRAASAICLTNGRTLRFVGPDGEEAAARQGQAFFYFGGNVEKFARVFAEVGMIVRPAHNGGGDHAE